LDESWTGPIGVIFFGVWQSPQPPMDKRYLPLLICSSLERKGLLFSFLSLAAFEESHDCRMNISRHKQVTAIKERFIFI
jgi:hypothetical protein